MIQEDNDAMSIAVNSLKWDRSSVFFTELPALKWLMPSRLVEMFNHSGWNLEQIKQGAQLSAELAVVQSFMRETHIKLDNVQYAGQETDMTSAEILNTMTIAEIEKIKKGFDE